jgi:hypothetical protein
MNRFSKPPLTQKEKDKKAKAFLNFIDNEECSSIINLNKNFKKEPVKTLYLRAPESYLKDIKEITMLTGLSMNAVCLELLRPAIKRKLREIKNDLL